MQQADVRCRVPASQVADPWKEKVHDHAGQVQAEEVRDQASLAEGCQCHPRSEKDGSRAIA